MKRKNPYSQINVNEVSIQELMRPRLGQKVVVGVDVSKAELTLCLVWPNREFERPWRIKSPGQIGLVISMLLELNRQCPVTVAMESSGTSVGSNIDGGTAALGRSAGDGERSIGR